MTRSNTFAQPHDLMDTPSPMYASCRIPVVALGMSLSLFIAITYVICVLFDLWFPQWAMNQVWAPLLPGFVWLSWPNFLLGFAESLAYGWYVALVFGPLYNFFSARLGHADKSA